MTQTKVLTSRLTCTFAFEDRQTAEDWAAETVEHVYRVEPADKAAERARMDMLWLTWMGEPGSSFKRLASQCRAYWAAESTGDVAEHAAPQWEWLFEGSLRILERMP